MYKLVLNGLITPRSWHQKTI